MVWQCEPKPERNLLFLALVQSCMVNVFMRFRIKKPIAAMTLSGLVFLGVSPSEADSKYVPTQTTLTDAVGRAVLLSDIQKAEIEAVVNDNPRAEKFICTGIRLVGTSDRMNLVVRKRAKEACDYAKQLNPKLSTWYQSKTTKARSYNGRVLLVLKTPKDKAD